MTNSKDFDFADFADFCLDFIHEFGLWSKHIHINTNLTVSPKTSGEVILISTGPFKRYWAYHTQRNRELCILILSRRFFYTMSTHVNIDHSSKEISQFYHSYPSRFHRLMTVATLWWESCRIGMRLQNCTNETSHHHRSLHTELVAQQICILTTIEEKRVEAK